MPAFEEALAALYQAPLSAFVTERKRLAKELKSSGDAEGARRLAGRSRPNISAWTVNQLYWQARKQFDAVLTTAAPLRSGSLTGGAQHRDALSVLRRRAAEILEESGHAAGEATLRRVMTTVSAIAAAGGFAPDAPGTLSADRDPPGFEAVGIEDAEHARGDSPLTHGVTRASTSRSRVEGHAGARGDADGGDRDRRRREEAVARERERKEREHAQRQREELEKARKQREAERRKLEAELAAKERDCEAKERLVDDQREALTRAEHARDRARKSLEEVRERLAHLDREGSS